METIVIRTIDPSPDHTSACASAPTSGQFANVRPPKPYELQVTTWQLDGGYRWRRCSLCGGGKIHAPEFIASAIDKVCRDGLSIGRVGHDALLLQAEDRGRPANADADAGAYEILAALWSLPCFAEMRARAGALWWIELRLADLADELRGVCWRCSPRRSHP